MRISIEKKEFAEGVHNSGRFAEKGSSTLPALGSIIIVAGQDGIKLRATNLETGIDLTLKGVIQEEGVIALSAALLIPFASSLSGEGTLTIERAGDAALVTTSSGKSTVRTVPYEDFPIIPFPEGKNKLTLGGALIKQLFSALSACASHSSVRPELASIYLSVEQGALTLVATDSFRLVEKKIALNKSSGSAKLLIPAKNALDIAQALPDEDVTLSFDDHQCAFSWSSGHISTRLTNATYPDYRQIIPKESTAEAVVLAKDFELGLRRATIFSDQFQKVKLEFDPKKKALELSAKNPDFGESTETVPANLKGAALELSFNHRYLSSVFSLTSGESLALSAAGIGRPLTIRSQGDASFLYLVSPMNQ